MTELELYQAVSACRWLAEEGMSVADAARLVAAEYPGISAAAIERYARPAVDALAWHRAGGATENSEGKQ